MKAENGFTLVEVLVALTIFAVGLLAIATMQLTAIQMNSRANTNTSRSALAQKILEEILSRDAASPFFDSAVSPGTTWDLDPATSATSLDLEGSGTCTATYSVLPNDPVANVAKITVVVNVGTRATTLIGYKRSL